ncbi:MAG: putative sulfate exporter family transporter [Chloroflexi bacterium]|nr:putative sulfate exporter family transporter [Chloroflexota bacterium]
MTVLAVVALAMEQTARWLTGTPAPLVEALVVALLLGVLMRNTIGMPAAAERGVALMSKPVLEAAVALLGATISAGQVIDLGLPVLALTLACVALALGLSLVLGRRLGLGPRLATLIAVGSAICGNSAIAAVAPVIKAEKREVASAIAVTSVIGVALVLTLPELAPLFALTDAQYGVVVGTTVYAVPQVVAASFPISVEAGQVATVVKLVRVTLIGPVVLVLALLWRTEGSGSWRSAFRLPWFITGFLVLAVLASSGLLAGLSVALGLPPTGLATMLRDISKALMIGAMAALGLGVLFASVRTVGPQVLAAVVGSTVVLVAASLALVVLLRPI